MKRKTYNSAMSNRYCELSLIARRGLTLVELLVVLVILAVLTTIAVQATDNLLLQSRFDSSQRTLQNLQNAVGPLAVSSSETTTFSGFVADMGRLPLIVQENRGALGNVLTLSELWTKPGAAFLWGFKPSLAPEPDGAIVVVPCGWRGPYINLPAGSLHLLDGWGTELVSPVDAAAQVNFPYACLQDLTNTALTSPGLYAAFVVRSPGKNKTTDVIDPGDYNRDVEIRLNLDDYRAGVQGIVEINLTVSVKKSDDTAETDPTKISDVTTKVKNALTGTVRVKVFGPDALNPGQVGVVTNDFVMIGRESSFVFDLLTAGPRVLRAYLAGGSFATVSDVQITPSPLAALIPSIQIPLSLRPGPNVLPRIRIPVAVVAKQLT